MSLNRDQLDSLTSDNVSKVSRIETDLWNTIIAVLLNSHKKASKNTPDAWKNDMLKDAKSVLKRAGNILDKPFSQIKEQELETIYNQAFNKSNLLDKWLNKAVDTGYLDKPKKRTNIHKLINTHKASAGEYIDLARLNMTKNSYETFKKIISDAALSARNGVMFDKALADTMSKWSDYGIPALIDKAGKRWAPDVYMRSVLNNEINKAVNDAELTTAKDFGGLVKVSWHAGSRPSHAQFQGNIYSLNGDTVEYPNFYLATDYGSAGGLCGINCRHYFYTYVPGYGEFMPPEYSQKDADLYKTQQEQRRLEREVRKAKRKYDPYTYLDKNSGKRFKNNWLRKKADLAEFISANNLRRQPQREVNRIASSESEIRKAFEQRTVINKDKFNRHVKGTKQYEEYLKRGTNSGQEPSYLTISLEEAQKEIYNRVSVNDLRHGECYIKLDKTVGTFVNQTTGKKSKTQWLKVHFSKKDCHIVPANPKRG